MRFIIAFTVVVGITFAALANRQEEKGLAQASLAAVKASQGESRYDRDLRRAEEKMRKYDMEMKADGK